MTKRKQTPKVCYVIMPFSDTKTCNEGQWTTIFNGLIKPAVEDAGLGYKCVRSKATTGNLIKKIVQDLYSANVVVADLTDQKPNVFYELGVRHTLRNRTILTAQRRKDIPSDLDGYASHVYDWKTNPGQDEFKANIRDSLHHIEQDPDRSDNPVSDFLRDRSHTVLEFRREENSQKLRALIQELDLISTVLAEFVEKANRAGAANVPGLRQPSPALEHLIATQYVYNPWFSRSATALRGMLELLGDEDVPLPHATDILRNVKQFKRNTEKILRAYEAADPLAGVRREPGDDQ